MKCVCVCACVRVKLPTTDISSHPSELLLSSFPQPRHNIISATFPHVLPFDSHGLYKAHQKPQHKGGDGTAQVTHISWGGGNGMCAAEQVEGMRRRRRRMRPITMNEVRQGGINEEEEKVVD